MDDIEWIRESNLIEDIDSQDEDKRSLRAWNQFKYQTYLHIFNILELHRQIVFKQFEAEDRKADAGRVRLVNVRVGNRVCPHFSEVPKLLEQWIVAYRLPKTEEGIKEAHIKFEKIHPFIDGNGRVGRMVMNYQRFRIGLPPLLIKASEREKYYEWFK